MTGNELVKLAWDKFGKWLDKWYKDHPEDERDAYELSKAYGHDDTEDLPCHGEFWAGEWCRGCEYEDCPLDGEDR